jgi:hypothetical protein
MSTQELYSLLCKHEEDGEMKTLYRIFDSLDHAKEVANSLFAHTIEIRNNSNEVVYSFDKDKVTYPKA